MSDENPAFLQEKIEYLQLSAFRDIFLREREEKTQSHLTVPLVPAACYLTPLPPITFYSGVSIVTYKCIVTYRSDYHAGNRDAGNRFALGKRTTPRWGTKPHHAQHGTTEGRESKWR